MEICLAHCIALNLAIALGVCFAHLFICMFSIPSLMNFTSRCINSLMRYTDAKLTVNRWSSPMGMSILSHAIYYSLNVISDRLNRSGERLHLRPVVTGINGESVPLYISFNMLRQNNTTNNIKI